MYLMKVILETYLMKVIPETYLMKVIPETYLMKFIPETYLMKVIPETLQHYMIKFASELLRVGSFLQCTPVSSANITNHHDIAELVFHKFHFMSLS
jgi:lipid II:glycine glycyltransferase (peptidoglycan interpeptide bridge formation enzyme)